MDYNNSRSFWNQSKYLSRLGIDSFSKAKSIFYNILYYFESIFVEITFDIDIFCDSTLLSFKCLISKFLLD